MAAAVAMVVVLLMTTTSISATTTTTSTEECCASGRGDGEEGVDGRNERLRRRPTAFTKAERTFIEKQLTDVPEPVKVNELLDKINSSQFMRRTSGNVYFIKDAKNSWRAGIRTRLLDPYLRNRLSMVWIGYYQTQELAEKACREAIRIYREKELLCMYLEMVHVGKEIMAISGNATRGQRDQHGRDQSEKTQRDYYGITSLVSRLIVLVGRLLLQLSPQDQAFRPPQQPQYLTNEHEDERVVWLTHRIRWIRSRMSFILRNRKGMKVSTQKLAMPVHTQRITVPSSLEILAGDETNDRLECNQYNLGLNDDLCSDSPETYGDVYNDRLLRDYIGYILRSRTLFQREAATRGEYDDPNLRLVPGDTESGEGVFQLQSTSVLPTWLISNPSGNHRLEAVIQAFHRYKRGNEDDETDHNCNSDWNPSEAGDEENDDSDSDTAETDDQPAEGMKMMKTRRRRRNNFNFARYPLSAVLEEKIRKEGFRKVFREKCREYFRRHNETDWISTEDDEVVEEKVDPEEIPRISPYASRGLRKSQQEARIYYVQADALLRYIKRRNYTLSDGLRLPKARRQSVRAMNAILKLMLQHGMTRRTAESIVSKKIGMKVVNLHWMIDKFIASRGEAIFAPSLTKNRNMKGKIPINPKGFMPIICAEIPAGKEEEGDHSDNFIDASLPGATVRYSRTRSGKAGLSEQAYVRKMFQKQIQLRVKMQQSFKENGTYGHRDNNFKNPCHLKPTVPRKRILLTSARKARNKISAQKVNVGVNITRNDPFKFARVIKSGENCMESEDWILGLTKGPANLPKSLTEGSRRRLEDEEQDRGVLKISDKQLKALASIARQYM